MKCVRCASAAAIFARGPIVFLRLVIKGRKLWKFHVDLLFNPKLAPEVGFEPTTNRLTADRSTTELLWIVQRSIERREICPDASTRQVIWLRGLDLNQRPSGYEPDELPGCSTPRRYYWRDAGRNQIKVNME